MILQLAIIGGCIWTIDRLWDHDRRWIKRTWKRTMEENNLMNDKGSTYNIARINPAEYGFLLIVSMPPGYSFKELNDKKEILESSLKGVVEMEHDLFNGWITMRLVKNPLKDLHFEPVKTRPNELYLGYTYYEHIIADMNVYPHLLIAGINGSGKTRGLYTILTNLLHNHTVEEIEIYMSQIGKTDLLIYRDCPQVRKFARSPEDSLKMYRYLYGEMKRREKVIEGLMKQGTYNIEDYNRRHKEALRYIYVVSDEFSLYMPDATDSRAEKDLKEECLDTLKKLIKLGRAYGIFVIMSLQKTTNDQMPQLLKSQVNCKMTFRQTDVYSSRNIIDNDDALTLQKREAILISDRRYRVKTPFIDDMLIKKYLLNAAGVTEERKSIVDLHVKLHTVKEEDGVIRRANG
ncbi:MAG TPA: FtsK/SpoIIIE domain-containing protein [Clostridia bacterium]|nr:FtsK/SpoIIIE domain-containing protein [Clostridia bacterium]